MFVVWSEPEMYTGIPYIGISQCFGTTSLPNPQTPQETSTKLGPNLTAEPQWRGTLCWQPLIIPLGIFNGTQQTGHHQDPAISININKIFAAYTPITSVFIHCSGWVYPAAAIDFRKQSAIRLLGHTHT